MPTIELISAADVTEQEGSLLAEQYLRENCQTPSRVKASSHHPHGLFESIRVGGFVIECSVCTRHVMTFEKYHACPRCQDFVLCNICLQHSRHTYPTEFGDRMALQNQLQVERETELPFLKTVFVERIQELVDSRPPSYHPVLEREQDRTDLG